MIIRYPTGFYRDVLPKNPEDSGSVTFLISNTAPPRTNLVYPKVPTGVVNRTREFEPPPVIERRQALGELIFSVSSAKRREAGNNSRQYEIGQLLEFNDQTADEAVEPMAISNVTEIQHNTNVLDYDAAGITSEEQSLVATASLQAQADLTAALNAAKQARADAEIIITTQQKLINELNRSIDAFVVVVQIQPNAEISAIIAKLRAKVVAETAILDQAIANANEQAEQAAMAATGLRALAVVVK